MKSFCLGYLRDLTLVSPAAGNLKSHNALLGTRFRILHLKDE